MSRRSYVLRHPRLLMHQIRRWVYERRHPDHPWLAPRAIQILEELLRTDMRALEWGSGRSTVWLARRVGRLLSVESDPGWYARTRQRLDDAAISNVDLRSIPTTERDEPYWADNPYVMVVDEYADASLDFVLVDGLFRQNCVARVTPKIAPRGLLVIDQSHHLARLEDWGVPAGWNLVHEGDRLNDTSIWQRP